MSQQWLKMSAGDLGRGIGAGDIDPVALTRTYLDAIKSHPLQHRIYARLTEARALAEAAAAAKRATSGQRRGLLDGVPISWKDLFDTAGVATEAGCDLLKGRVPDVDAEVLKNATEAGLVCLGKTHMSELAFSGLGFNPVTQSPPSVNDADAVSGGSSSGAATSVAFDLAACGIGSDTGGSVRIPAAWNNLVGLKATKGLLSTAGVVPACRTLDCVTFFTATAAEASHLLALCTQAMQPDERDEFSRANLPHNDAAAFQPPRKGLRVGVPRQLEFLGCSESPSLFVEALGQLEAIGGVSVSIDFSPFLEAARLLYEGPWVAERYSTIEALLQERPEEILPVIRDVLRKAPQFSAVDTFRAQYRLQQLKAECDRILATVDCVVTPAYPRPVTLEELREQPVQRNSDLGWYTNFMNMLDYAAVATPMNFMKNGLPWGITVFGPAFSDQMLLGVADALQRAHGRPLAGQRHIESRLLAA